jgi:hypothetical protein
MVKMTAEEYEKAVREHLFNGFELRDKIRWEQMMRVVANVLHIDFSIVEEFHQHPVHPANEKRLNDLLNEFGECMTDALKDQGRQ